MLICAGPPAMDLLVLRSERYRKDQYKLEKKSLNLKNVPRNLI